MVQGADGYRTHSTALPHQVVSTGGRCAPKLGAGVLPNAGALPNVLPAALLPKAPKPPGAELLVEGAEVAPKAAVQC